MNEIYLIFELILDSSENESSRALTYEPVGFVETQEEAQQIIDESPMYSKKDCWAIMDGSRSKYSYQLVPKITSHACKYEK